MLNNTILQQLTTPDKSEGDNAKKQSCQLYKPNIVVDSYPP